MVDKVTNVLDLLKDKYQLRVQLSDGVSAKLIGPVHRIFLTIGRTEKRFHLGDEDLENLIVNIAWEKLGMDFTSSDMSDLKVRLKKMVDEIPVSIQKK
jgi:hypothetical protein